MKNCGSIKKLLELKSKEYGVEPRPYLSGYFRIRGLKLNWLYKFSPWFDVMLHVKFESPMRTAIGKYSGEWHVRVMST